MQAMAKCGFDCELVEEPPTAVQSECPVCLLVLRQPYQVTCCGYAFCRVCIDSVRKNKLGCPWCNGKRFRMFEDKRLKRSLYALKVYCTNKQQGCQWEGELRQLDNHLKYPLKDKTLEGCQFTKIKCLYCRMYFLRSDVQIHQREQCSKRPHSCQYCKKFNSSYEDVTTNHWPKCVYYPLHCPNKCGETLQRQNLQSHITNDCPLTIIDCDFQHVGCEVRLPRKDMPAHLQEGVVRHLSLQTVSYKQTVTRLEDENKELIKKQTAMSLKFEEEIQQLREEITKLTQDLHMQKICTPICPVEFKLTNFEQKRKDKKWRSSPFYTRIKGYKLCFNVCVHGDGRYYTGAYVSVGITLMKGEFDDQLMWPFRGKFEIQLLNNKGHYKKMVDFHGAVHAGNRVTVREKSDISRCIFDFISHEDLRPKYLNIKDCLNFRIKVLK